MTDDVLTLEGLRRRRAEILGVARKRRAHRIAVFGSVARGEAHPGSDLDLLVDFEPGASLLDHVGLFQDLEELLGGMRIIAAHAYHRIDYDEVWVTLRDDVPQLDKAISRWRQTQI